MKFPMVPLTVVYLDENGEEQTMEVSLNDKARMARSGVSVNRDENGNLVVDFGSQIAVKKVTLTITGTKNNTNLAEISKVEFLNNTEHRIPAPDMSIPQHVAATAGDKNFWSLGIMLPILLVMKWKLAKMAKPKPI